ncbi:MAG: hypothetical protein K6C97_01540 [Treponema sp.]|nr:hypothetical protein [Treponema sp.]
MKIDDIKLLPDMVNSGKLSPKQAIDELGGFISSNYPVFGLNKYDEDFRSDIILMFLEKGNKILETYNEETSDFFTYLYSTISSLINTRRKKLAIQALKENIDYYEGINMNSEKVYFYKNLSPITQDLRDVPFAYKPQNIDALKQMFRQLAKENCDKKILVLAIKASFYITDEQVKKVCKIYNLKEKDLYDAIQYCKNSLDEKAQKRTKIQERRNYAYYHHKKYDSQLEKIKDSERPVDSIRKNNILEKQQKHYKNWQKLNKKFSDGFLFLRPTNKTVADLLGICERQISYYINCAKQDYKKGKRVLDIEA